MQARTKKLEPVVQHVDNNEQKALQAVAYSQAQLKLQIEILQKLHDYKQEYLNGSAGGLGEHSVSALQLQEFHRFLAQLDETIRQQSGIVDRARHELDVKRQKWQTHRSKSQAMHKVVDRIVASEQQQQQAREQKIMDEIALRNLNRRV
jgi:flagellar export protein FliJ